MTPYSARIGERSLQVGKKADIVLVDLDSPRMMPVHSVPSALVYNANGGDVDTVIVNGQVLMRGKRVVCVDEAALLKEARAACARLFERAGIGGRDPSSLKNQTKEMGL